MWFEILKNKLTNLPYKDLFLTLENNIRGGISSVMGDRFVKSGEKKYIICRC